MKTRSGFTILEISLLISVILLTSSAILASYGRFLQRQLLVSDAQKLIDVLSLAKSKTIAGDSSLCIPSATSRIDRYSVVVQNSSSYLLQPLCSSGVPVIQRYRTNIGVSFLSSTYPISVSFSPLARGATQGAFKLSNRFNECRCVRVSPNGVVSEDALVSCSNTCT